MAEDVQGLLEKIHSDGIAKAEQEKESILNAAKQEAAEIVAKAKQDAETFAKNAKAEAEADQRKATEAIRQAARDTVIALRSNLLERLNAVSHACIGEAMTPEVMAQIVLKMAEAYGKNPDAADSLEILLPKKEQEQTEACLKSRLLADLKADPQIKFTNEFNSGLQIAFRGTEVYFDFSDDALTEVLCRFVGPKLTAVIKG